MVRNIFFTYPTITIRAECHFSESNSPVPLWEKTKWLHLFYYMVRCMGTFIEKGKIVHVHCSKNWTGSRSRSSNLNERVVQKSFTYFILKSYFRTHTEWLFEIETPPGLASRVYFIVSNAKPISFPKTRKWEFVKTIIRNRVPTICDSCKLKRIFRYE